MPTRKAHARWEGSLKEGKGRVDFGNGAFQAAYSFASRFEDGKGTNPEELLGAAHAGCFAMALSLILGQRGLQSPARGDGRRIRNSDMRGRIDIVGFAARHEEGEPEGRCVDEGSCP